MPTYDENMRKLWWDGLTESGRAKALESAGAKPGEAGIAAAWAHSKAPREAQVSRHPSLGLPIPKD